jgi:D-alanyl-lipoteichoic acid acyltransferase DltB (MBOAT superfamily)
MLFNSIDFAVFLPLVFLLYWTVFNRSLRLQNAFLLVVSAVFYGWWDWRYLGLVFISAAIDYVVAISLDGTSDEKRRRWLLTLSMVANLGMLGFFKYCDFFITSFNDAFTFMGMPIGLRTLNIVLPVGISFYTFQTMSYTIDVYRRKIAPERSLLAFAAFASMFPQLVAGPIERGSDMLPQLHRRRELSLARLYEGSWLILWGLFKKVFVADNAATIVDLAFGDAGALSRGEAALGLYAFALQIYGDFSGYTDIARGTAKMLGFDFRLNFARPYLAVDPSDFWRRWHISLSSWLRDYLYVSLGGNRRGAWLTARNLILTMLLGGLWHGASWTFVLWGGYHGALLVAHRALSPLLRRLPGHDSSLYRLVARLSVFHLVVFGWLPFRAPTLHEVGAFASALVQGGAGGVVPPNGWTRLAGLACLVVLHDLAEERWPDPVARLPAPLRAVVYVIVVIGLVVAGAPGGQSFLYFQF